MDLIRKLQIRPGATVAVLNPPDGVELPPGGADAATADVVIAFVTRHADLTAAEPALAAARADRLAWIGYPKGGGLGTDLNRDLLAAAVAGHGVQPVRQVAVDEVWSALRLRPATRD